LERNKFIGNGLTTPVNKVFKDLKKLSRDYWLLMCSAGLGSLGWSLYYIVYPLYMKAAGYGGTELGILSSINTFLAMIWTFIGGVLTNYMSAKRIFLIFWSLSTFSYLPMAFSTRFEILLLSSILSSLGSISMPAYYSYISEVVRREDLDLAYSVEQVMFTAAGALGSLLGFIPVWLSETWRISLLESYMRSLLLVYAIGVASLIPVFKIRDLKVSGGKVPVFKPKGVLGKILLVELVIGFGAGLSIPLIFYYLSVKYGVESGELGVLNFFLSLTLMASTMLNPLFSKRFGTVKTSAFLQASSIPLLVALTISPNIPAAFIVVVLRNTLMNMANPLVTSAFMKAVKEEERGMAPTYMSLGFQIGEALSMPLGGYIMDNIWLDLPFYITAIIYTLYVTLYYTAFKHVDLT